MDPSSRTAPPEPAPTSRPLLPRLALGFLRWTAAALVALVLVELGLRALGYGVPPRGPNNRLPLRTSVPPEQVPRLHEGLRPGASGSVLYPGFGHVPDRTVDYAINADGFRDDDRYARPKPEGVYRIVCLGDSVTYGTGVQVEDTFPERLEERFAAGGLDCRVEVMNCGVYAHNTSQQVAWFEVAARRFEPDLVLVTSTIPDASGKNLPPLEREPTGAARWIQRLGLTSGVWTEGAADAPAALRRTMWLRRRSVLADVVAHHLYARLISEAERSNYRQDWAEGSPGLRMVEQSLARLAQGARRDGFELRVAIFPTLEHLDAAYPYAEQHTRLAGICAELGVPFLDLFEAFEGLDGPSLRVHPHDHHPNARAHALAAAAYQAWLADTVCQD